MADTSRTIEKIVVVFDICSSTKIIEDVILSGHIDTWRRFLMTIKEYLEQEEGADVYKFVGDGWILLFDASESLDAVLDFMFRFGRWFEQEFNSHIGDILQQTPSVTGLTFGLDSGQLVEFTMSGVTEYVGRPLNVACRLQGATKVNDDSPQYKLLVSKPLFNRTKKAFVPYPSKPLQYSLSNILDGKPVDCMKVDLRTQSLPKVIKQTVWHLNKSFRSTVTVDNSSDFVPTDFHFTLLTICRQLGAASLQDLQQRTGDVKMKIRNNLQQLRNAGLLREESGETPSFKLTHMGQMVVNNQRPKEGGKSPD